MLFHSFEFACFLPLVFFLYWFICQHSLRWQNLLVVVASYTFYGWWDQRFLGLLLASSLIDYSVGLGLQRSEAPLRRKLLLALSLTANLGMLFYFKYCNFFIDSFIHAFSGLGLGLHVRSLDVILPVGISFYTFQTLSYSIDVYRGNLKATKDPIAFLAFVSFFPQLVAGPIERATHLIPQFLRPRQFDYAVARDGALQMMWGFFKKILIADTAAPHVDYFFAHYSELDSLSLLLGAVYFAFHIYGDFSGYSDIAIGLSKLFGFDLMTNFKLPYFSRDIAEFWRRWHISLSTWFRDYLYIPLGGSKGGRWMQFRNVMIIFIVSGFWHGANWTFVIWGLLNGLYYLPLMLSGRNRSNTGQVAPLRFWPSLREVGQMAMTFFQTTVAWVFFRATDMGEALGYLGRMLGSGSFQLPEGHLAPLAWIAVLVSIEWVQRRKAHGFAFERLPFVLRWSAYAAVAICLFWGYSVDKAFIYFQF